MRLLHHLKSYFTTWWMPPLGYFICISVFFQGVLLQRDALIDLSLWLFLINTLGTLAASVVQIAIGQWYYIFIQLGVAALLFFYTAMIFTFSPPDYYGAHKEIPEDMDFSYPLENVPTEADYAAADLLLENYGQPGIYRYHTDFHPEESGYFYIRAYEVTSNDRLSEERMKARSKVYYEPGTAETLDGKFTIYEGSWGDHYGGRIELWFAPKGDREEYKVAERNYIVEGWMR